MKSTDVVECLFKPWLLDSRKKVNWANRVAGRKRWKLGNHCWYQPAKEMR